MRYMQNHVRPAHSFILSCPLFVNVDTALISTHSHRVFDTALKRKYLYLSTISQYFFHPSLVNVLISFR